MPGKEAFLPEPIELDQHPADAEAQPKEHGKRDTTSTRQPLFAQSFLAALPIVLTVVLGFVANYYQSVRQHKEQLAVLAEQGALDRQKQDRLGQDAQRARLAETDRTFTLQDRDAKAQLARQAREFAANAAAASRQAADQQLTLRAQNAAQQAQQAREFAQSLERQRRQAEVEIIIKASEVPTSLTPEQQDVQRARNLLWFADAGYIRVSDANEAKLREVGKVAAGQSVPLPVTQSGGATAGVRDYQRTRSLASDGILGPVTCSKAFTDEKAAPGSIDHQLLDACRVRFPAH